MPGRRRNGSKCAARSALRFLAALGASVGGLAALNAVLASKAAALGDVLEGRRLAWRWRGYEIFAIEAGSGPLVLLVHGIYAGSSSYEFRRLFPLLAQRYRVVAFDLLGNGRSERPAIAYSAALFSQQIADAVAYFGPEAAAVIGSSLGAAFTIRAVAGLGDKVGALVAVCPTGAAGTLDQPPQVAGMLVTRLLLSPLLGQALFNALASRPSLAWFLKYQAYADPASVTREIVDHYWTVTHQRGARYVPAHFVGGALNCRIVADLASLEIPVLIAWGERAHSTAPLEGAREYLSLARYGRLTTFANSGLLPHEEEPDACAARIERFIAGRTP